MSNYKLTYFNANGIAEPIRWALKIAGVDFEDERIEFADWPQIKDSGRFPIKKIPLLDIDGKVFTQSNAILRYLARQFNLESEDPLLSLKIDQITDIFVDLRFAFMGFFQTFDDADKKEELKQNLATNFLPLGLQNVTDVLESSPRTDEGDFIAGSKLTWGDLVVANWLQIWEDLIDPNLLQKFPALTKLRDAVHAVPEIKAWLEIRPNAIV